MARRAADGGLNPDADVRWGLFVTCLPGSDQFVMSQHGERWGKISRRGHGVTPVICAISARNPRECINVVNVMKFMSV